MTLLTAVTRWDTVGNFELEEFASSGNDSSCDLYHRAECLVAIVHRCFRRHTHSRRNMEDKTQHRLARELEIALMEAHLRLDITQMTDNQVMQAFQRVAPLLAPHNRPKIPWQ